MNWTSVLVATAIPAGAAHVRVRLDALVSDDHVRPPFVLDLKYVSLLRQALVAQRSKATIHLEPLTASTGVKLSGRLFALSTFTSPQVLPLSALRRSTVHWSVLVLAA